MQSENFDTICAIATAPGESGIGIVRLSGTGSLSIAQKIFKSEAEITPRNAVYGTFFHSRTYELVDRGILLYFQAPHSYTGEDSVEFQCHGSMVVLNALLDACIGCGAKLAAPGEFTQRAFLNGKLDLSQAEAVADLISSQTSAQSRMALRQLDGELSKQIHSLAAKLMTALVHVEATLDFSEEIGDMDFSSLLLTVSEVKTTIDKLLEEAKFGQQLREGCRIAIVGKPNVGKSSLMNRLLGKDRAIVTAVPGTTRDTIEENFHLEGMPINIIDTAGLRVTEDAIELIGISKTYNAIKNADLLILMIDHHDQLEELNSFQIDSRPVMVVLNKIDLLSHAQLKESINEINSLTDKHCAISSLSGEGVPEMLEKIKQLLFSNAVAYENASVSNIRHKQALDLAYQSLQLSEDSIKNQKSADCISLDLRDAIDHLGMITGETATEDIIARIFQDFCIGK